MLWAKDHKANFSEKFPHLDPSQQTAKKLNDLWAQVPQAEKKMWKNRAAKMMKANTGENMKNTAPPPIPKTPKRKKPKTKVTLSLEGLSEQKTKNTAKKPSGKGKGRGRRKLSDSSLNDDLDDIIAPPPKTPKAKVTKAPAKGKKPPPSKNGAASFHSPPASKTNGRKPPSKGLGNLNVATMRAMSNNFSKVGGSTSR